MPMAGRGSRFAKDGITEPKPLVDLGGRPFFWWATESIRRAAEVDNMAFVVLAEHEASFGISNRIHEFYPHAVVIEIPDITAGSAETAYIGLSAFEGQNPVAINDCDHAFISQDLNLTLERLTHSAEAALMCFPSSNPGFSYVQLNGSSEVCGTVEKQVASPYAIAGCYLFRSAEAYEERYRSYKTTCNYNELFISGIYNEILWTGKSVDLHVLQSHFPFGTPEELKTTQIPMLAELSGWL
jgi:dTDP-glucose pyrophosphorylase